jgi:arginine deiminase
VGLGLVDETRAYLDSLKSQGLPESAGYRPPTCSGRVIPVREARTPYLMPPLPNTLYTRDTTCWIYGGVTLNPLFWPARHDETLLMKATASSGFHWARSVVGRPEQDWEWPRRGRRRHDPRHGVVLIGMSERSSRQAVTRWQLRSRRVARSR